MSLEIYVKAECPDDTCGDMGLKEVIGMECIGQEEYEFQLQCENCQTKFEVEGVVQ